MTTLNLLIALAGVNRREKKGLQSDSAIVVVSTFPSCGRLTFPQHLDITPRFWWLLPLLHRSSIFQFLGTAGAHSGSLSLFLLCPTSFPPAAHSAAQEGQGREKGSADTNPVAASFGVLSMQGLAAPRSVLAQRSVLQDTACETVSASPLTS